MYRVASYCRHWVIVSLDDEDADEQVHLQPGEVSRSSFSTHTRHIASTRSHKSPPDIRLARLYLHQTDKIPVSGETGRRSSRVADYHHRRIGYFVHSRHHYSLLLSQTGQRCKPSSSNQIRERTLMIRFRPAKQLEIPAKGSRHMVQRSLAIPACSVAESKETGWLERDRSQQQTAASGQRPAAISCERANEQEGYLALRLLQLPTLSHQNTNLC